MIEKELADRFAPPEDPDFFERLWIRAEQAERRAARRWRLVAIAAVCAAGAATTAAGVLAFGGNASARVIDLTVVCTANDEGGVNAFNVSFTAGKGPVGPAYGTFGVWTTPSAVFYPGYMDTSNRWHAAARMTAAPPNCRTSRQKIPLAPSGLAARETSSAPAHDGLQCWVSRAVFRARVTFDAQGTPVASAFAMRNARTGKPLAFAQVTRTRLVDYAADACLHD